ncbi:MAG TPA: carboxypeptidase-like regulatory domain-containing protein, partial [Candidatus Wunengus sp. YC63]|uniref:carboxypeptidase-like regulatory domain-containing protein n=1 Tax=Candidatus Wunengus sp. YC63 TaxID=3367699 RepID=UPI00402660FB
MKMGNRVSIVSLLAVVLTMGFLPNVFSGVQEGRVVVGSEYCIQNSKDIPTTSGAYDTSYSNHDVFVLKPEILLSQSAPTLATGTIMGTVKDYDPDAGISDATVATDTGGYSTTTDAEGSYTLSNVAAGTYSLTASKAGYESSTYGVGVGSGSYSFLNFTLKRSPKIDSIKGNVTDSTGSAISDATVKTDTGGYSTTTDANGSYTLSNVAAGTYTLTASKVGYNPESHTVTVTEDGTSTVDFSLTRELTPTTTPTTTPTLPPIPTSTSTSTSTS